MGNTMKTLMLASALALGTMTSAALADSVKPTTAQLPVKLTDAQMDKVVAGDNVCVVCVSNVGAQVLTNKSNITQGAKQGDNK
jgi:hypothetical protein